MFVRCKSETPLVLCDALQAVSSSYYQYPTGLEKNPDDYAIRQANLRAYVTLSKVVAHAFDVLWVNV
ncbi:hypothetical protein SPHINGOR109_70043 [Sphingorhabdus sp. 109]|nr:hypothetical protein SPHINGOR109_70043 [Sphingorhabdus sp. 109]